MNWWEQFILGTVLSILNALKINPAGIPTVSTILTDIYNGIGEIMGWPTAPISGTPAILAAANAQVTKHLAAQAAPVKK